MSITRMGRKLWLSMAALLTALTVGGLTANAVADGSGGGGATISCAQGTCQATFSVDSTTVQSWTPPPGVSTATVTVAGAAGGDDYLDRSGGEGGSVTATVAALTPSNSFAISVGGAGDTGSAGYFGGGSSTGSGGGGGGYSEVAVGSTAEIVAGGGGGSGTDTTNERLGGSGGQVGTPGLMGPSASGTHGGTLDGGGGGGGGTASQGGAGGAAGTFSGDGGCDPFAGSRGSDGASLSGGTPGTGRSGDGGGGGGGWYGGGGGGGGAAETREDDCGDVAGVPGAGGGGSSYVNPSGPFTDASYTTGTQAGDGTVSFSYPDPIDAPTLDEVTRPGATVTVNAANGLLGAAGASGPSGDTLNLVLNTQAANGTAQVNPDGFFSYTPNAGSLSADSFTYTVSDAAGDSATGTVTVSTCTSGTCQTTFSVAGPAVQSWTPPLGVSTATVTVAGAAGADSVSGVAGGVGGAVTATIASLSPLDRFAISVGGAGTLGEGGFFGGGGTDLSPFQAGGGGYSEVAVGSTAEIVAGAGGGAASDAVGGPGGEVGTPGVAGEPTTGSQGGTLDGGGGGAGGTASQGGAGGAGGSFSGDDGCDPQDGDAGGDGGPLRGGNGAGGVGAAGGAGWYGGGGGGAGATELDGNDCGAPSGDPGSGGGGSSYVNPSGPFTDASYTTGTQAGDGTVSFSYPDPVSAPTLNKHTGQNSTLAVSAADGVLGTGGATGPSGDTLSAALETQAAHGTVAVNPDGSFTYTPEADYQGDDSFTYTASDAAGYFADGTVEIAVVTVVAPDAPGTPTATAGATGTDTASVAFGAPSSDGGGTISGYTVTAVPATGSPVIANGTGSPITVGGLTPDVAYTFTVTATNSGGTSQPSAPSNATTDLADNPSVAISTPANGATYTVGDTVSDSFTCTEGTGGTGIVSCADQNKQPAGTALSAATPGSYTLTVTATSSDGQTGTATVTYSVVSAPAATTTTPTTPPPTTTAQTTSTPTTTPVAVPRPALITAPAIIGTHRAGQVLTCAHGTWSDGPTGYGYTWERDGTPIAGATHRTYRLASADEGTTLTCTVTATNPTGTSPAATSRGVAIAVPKVAGCPAATGRTTATAIGPVRLGQTVAQLRAALPRSSARNQHNRLYLCLTPTGIRVGFASPRLLRSLPAGQRARYTHRVIWISTSNARFSVDGVRFGESVTRAARSARLSRPFRVGKNTWYLAPDGRETAVFKTRRGVIQEVGVATRALTGTTPGRQRGFLTSFGS